MAERRSKKFEATFHGDDLHRVMQRFEASGFRNESEFIRHNLFASAARQEIATREEISQLAMGTNRLKRDLPDARGNGDLARLIKLQEKLVKDLQKRIRERATR